ncbi:thioredoxin family protein [Candidatus Daviesbacteria bacterium]|nr:thioredoxin family protein [Candidatus Daviesbacteria bacterium]
MKQKIIELWKNDCEHCEATEPILKELEKEGYQSTRYNVETNEGQKVWQEYLDIINKYNTSQGYDVNFIYTPTLINPLSKQALSYPDRAPTKEEIIKLAEGGEEEQ